MRNLLPAVMIGGPPHAGKSVLVYALRQALLERGIGHYLLRACPDGEGNWYHEGDPTLVSILRMPHRGAWPSTFLERISQDIAHRCLPFLVDMGGRPEPSDAPLFRQCTHSILLLREDLPAATALWQEITDEYNLLPLAHLFSRLEGPTELTAREPVLEGTVVGLERHKPRQDYGPAFNELVQLVAALFGSYDLDDQKKTYFERAPTELVIDVTQPPRTLIETSLLSTPNNPWTPAMLQPYLESLPHETSMSVYGIGPNWLYASLAAHSEGQPLYQFDPKLPFGWVQPTAVVFGEHSSTEIEVKAKVYDDMTVLSLSFPHERLEYFQPGPLAFPRVPIEKGLILDGRIPHWLLTALTRLYQAAGVGWIAPFHPPLGRAVVAFSRSRSYQPGALVALPTP